MTSKERIAKTLSLGKDFMIVNAITQNRINEDLLDEMLKPIYDDLEVLEIIKDLLNDGVLWLEMEHEMVESELHKKKKQLIKEWIRNDK